MRRQISRRRVKKRRPPTQNSRMKFTVFLGIMLLAVFLGYLTAKFVVGPLIGYDADESPAKILQQESQDGENGAESGGDSDSSETEDVFSQAPGEGYALQFGAFSTEEGAQQMKEALQEQGIETEIVKTEDAYKVISPVVDTKEKALDALESLAEKDLDDVFVTSFAK